MKAHPWQVKLCEILERCKTEKGLRILLHAPPRVGKTVIISQRFPAWYLGINPTHKVGVACFNETHAKEQTKVTRDLMLDTPYRDMFPTEGTELVDGKRAPTGRFFTRARKAEADGQPSVVALGMNSGATGKGYDLLIIDDPYKSPEEAHSVVINERTIRWYTRGMSGRVGEEGNVIVLFHRYHENDLTAHFLKEGGWEYYRLPMLADDVPDQGIDPTGREVGEPLSPLRSKEWCERERAKDEENFLSLHQGLPGTHAGTLIRREWFEGRTFTRAPSFKRYVRGWDVALTQGSGNWTAGVLIGEDYENNIFVLDVYLDQVEGPDVIDLIEQMASLDPKDTTVAVEKSLASLSIVQELRKRLGNQAIPFNPVDVKGRDKWQRALPWVNRGKHGKIRCLDDAPWLPAFLQEITRFKNRKTDVDDQIDAMSVACEALIDSLGGTDEPIKVVAIGSHAYYEQLQQAQANLPDIEWFEKAS